MVAPFDLDNPNAAPLKANSFDSGDEPNTLLSGRVLEVDDELAPSPTPPSVEAAGPGAPGVMQLNRRMSDRIELQREKARLRMTRLVSRETPAEREARLARRRISDARYRAANREELKHREWKRRPGNAAWVEENVRWNAANSVREGEDGAAYSDEGELCQGASE